MNQPSIEQIHHFQQAFRQLKLSMRQGMSKIASRELGMEFNHFVVLFMINGGLTSPSLIRERMEVSASMVSHLLDRCQKAGLIARELDPEDSRRTVLSLTEQGQKMMDQLSEYYADRIRASGLTEDQLMTLTSQLHQLSVPFTEREESE